MTLIRCDAETRMWVIANVFGTMTSRSREAYRKRRSAFPRSTS